MDDFDPEKAVQQSGHLVKNNKWGFGSLLDNIVSESEDKVKCEWFI